jgi:hypothetical protein
MILYKLLSLFFVTSSYHVFCYNIYICIGIFHIYSTLNEIVQWKNELNIGQLKSQEGKKPDIKRENKSRNRHVGLTKCVEVLILAKKFFNNTKEIYYLMSISIKFLKIYSMMKTR